MERAISKNILFTIAYYDSVGAPLSSFEIWKYLIDYSNIGKKVEFETVLDSLKELKNKGLLEISRGFWVLKGKKELANKKIKRQKISAWKIKKQKKWARAISVLPYIQSVLVTGTLGMRNAKRGSDWDVIVITKKDRIWLGRFFITSLLHFLGKRRYGGKLKDRFCLNHFLALDGLIFEERNEYAAREISHAIALFGEQCLQKIFQLNEIWINKIKVNFDREGWPNIISFEKSSKLNKTKSFMEFFLERSGLAEKLNSFAKKAMIKKINDNPKTHQEGADIRVSDQALIFLPSPQREHHLRKARESLTKILG